MPDSYREKESRDDDGTRVHIDAGMRPVLEELKRRAEQQGIDARKLRLQIGTSGAIVPIWGPREPFQPADVV